MENEDKNLGNLVKDAYIHSSMTEAKINKKDSKRLTDEHTKSINKMLLFGWLLIVVILLISYIGEFAKGERSPFYIFQFILVTSIPALATLLLYISDPDRKRLRYEVIFGYFIMYVYAMMTGNTPLVFVYILPFLSLLVLYHEPIIILITGICTLLVNFISIFVRVRAGELTIRNSRDAEIQIAALFLCFLGAFLASRLYDKIHKQNVEYTAKLTSQNHAMQEMTMQTIMTIANTIDAKDEYTKGHSRRVAEYSYAIARELGYSEKEAQDVRFIGLLHDIGKIGIPDSVLNKPGRLTDEEYEVMKSHTTVGSDILKDIAMIKDLDTGARYHHERPDGHGYPEGLRGDAIPFIARIIAVADAYDAMSSNRVYRRHLEPDRVLYELKKGNGTQWDSECCNALITMIEDDRVPKIKDEPDSEMVTTATKLLSRLIDKAEVKASDNESLDSLTNSHGRETGKNITQDAILQNGKGFLFVFDIDHFRHINESHGFVTGDIYLKALTDLIRLSIDKPVISRFGADVFIVYTPETETIEQAEGICSRFFTYLTDRKKEDPTLKELSVSVGITEVMTEKDQVMVLYENATKALYVAKQLGGNNYYFHLVDDVYNDRASKETVDLDRLVDIINNVDRMQGGLLTVYPEFEKMYEYMTNLAERNRQQLHIILFTMTSTDNSKAATEERDDVMNILQTSIMSSIRNIDITTRYSSSQQAVVLLNLDSEQVANVTNRIMTEFFRSYDKRDFDLHYDTAEITPSDGNPEDKREEREAD